MSGPTPGGAHLEPAGGGPAPIGPPPRAWAPDLSKLVRDHDALAAAIRALQTRGGRVVMTNGGFDLLHVGHVRSLRDARSRGDALVVALNSDRSVRAYKGPGHPIHPETERAEVLCALACVDLVTIFDDPTVDRLLRLLRPDVHAKGTDYTKETVPERATAAELGIEVAIVGDPKDHSSRGLIERIRGGG